LATHGSGQVNHLNASAVEANLIQQLLDVFYSASGV
jgi:hypothetical protein